MRDADVRRIPIDVKQPGMYVVEAVLPPHRAYTIVIVSDIGLITKAAPGQVLAFTADRTTGKPIAGCDIRVLTPQKTVASGATGADGVFNARFEDLVSDDVISVANCGEQTTATDPELVPPRSASRDGRLRLHRQTHLPPGHTVHIKGFLRWRSHGALLPFDAKEIELRVSDITDKVIYRQRRTVDAFGAITGDVPLSTGAALGYYSVAVVSGDETASGSFEVQEYRQTGVRGPRRLRRTDSSSRAAKCAWRSMRATTSGSRSPMGASPGWPTANPTTHRCDGPTRRRTKTVAIGGARSRRSRARHGSMAMARPRSPCRSHSTSIRTTTPSESRRASPTPAAGKSAARRWSTRLTARS